MFKTALLASALLVSTTAAYASTEVIGRYDAWIAYAGIGNNGRPLCGALIRGEENKTFEIDYQGGIFYVLLKKRNWDIPEGTPVTFTVQIDQAPIWKLNGKGHQSSSGGGYIQFNFNSNETTPSGESTITEFTNLISNGSKVVFEFPNGTEPGWRGSLSGSSRAMQTLNFCTARLDKQNNPTQPFGGGKQEEDE